MNRWMLAGVIVLSLGNSGSALAAIPGFNATCPGAIEVHADDFAIEGIYVGVIRIP